MSKKLIWILIFVNIVSVFTMLYYCDNLFSETWWDFVRVFIFEAHPESGGSATFPLFTVNFEIDGIRKTVYNYSAIYSLVFSGINIVLMTWFVRGRDKTNKKTD